jgi:asparagine synthase (glutamine-hydrolysing)
MKLRGLLREAVIASFAPGQTAFLLSGGLDSTALVAIAADAGLSPLVAYSFCTGLPGDESELGRAEAVAARFGATLTTVRISPETLPSVFLSAVRSMEDLAWSPLPAAKFEAHRFIAADGFRRVISGLGADEILAGDPPALRSAAPVGSATPLASGQARVFREVLSELTVPAEVRPAQAHGLSVFAPYLHPAVVAFSSMLPMHMRTDGHLGKLALRWALRQLLPDDIRLQPKVSRPLSLSSAPEKVRSAWIEVFSSLLQDEDTLDLAGVSKDETAGFLYALREGPYSVESERMLFRMHSLSLLAGSI